MCFSMKITMKSSIWILISLMFSGRVIDCYRVQYDGGYESGRDVVQTRNTRYVDSASGSWNTNVGYTNSKGNDGDVLGGLLETVSSSGIGSSSAEKGEGNDQVNAKGSFQIKVDADAAGVRPTAILGGVLDNAATAIGSLADIAKTNFKSRRNFRGSFALEGNSYTGENGGHFEGQEGIIGTNGRDATTSKNTVTAISQSQFTSNSGVPNGFEVEGRRKDSGFDERRLLENIGTNRGIRNGQNKDKITGENLRNLQKEVTLPSLTVGGSSTFGSSAHISSNFKTQISGRKDGSYSIHPEDHDTVFETGQNSDFSESEESQEFQRHIVKGGRTPTTQFSRTLDYENESSNLHSNGKLFANIGSSGLTSTILKDVRVTTHTQEDANNIQNLKTASQTSSFKGSTSSNGNLHEHSHVDDYNESDESTDIENHLVLQKEATGKNGQNILANVEFDVKSDEEAINLGSQYSGIGHTTDYDSSSENEEADDSYLHKAEGKESEIHLQPSGYNRKQIKSSEHDHVNSGKYQNENFGIETVEVTRHTSEVGSARNIPHPTLVDFRPDTDYDSNESEEIEDKGSKIIRTVTVTSQINQARPIVEFQKGVTGDYLYNLRQQQSSGEEKSYTESSVSNVGKDLGIASEAAQNSRNRDLQYSSNLRNQEHFSGSKILQSEVATSTNVNDDAEDDKDTKEYNTGHSSYLLEQNNSQNTPSNGRRSYNKDLGIASQVVQNSQNREDLQFSSNLQNQENLSGSKIVRTKVITTTHFNNDAEDDEDINESGHSSYLLQESSSQNVASNGGIRYNKGNDDNAEIQKYSPTVVENGASSSSYVNGNQNFNSHISEHLDGEYSDNSEIHEKNTEYKPTEIVNSQAAQNELRSLGRSFSSNSRQLLLEHSKPELDLENNYASGVTITSLNPPNVGLTSDFTLTAGRTQNSRFQPGQLVRNGYNQNYDGNEESTNRRLIGGQQVIFNSKELPRSSITFESEARRHPISSSRKGQYFESRGEVADTFLDNEEPIVYPILGHKDQNPRRFSNYGDGSEYLRVIGGEPHVAPMRPGTKIVRKEITETVHTSGGPPHANEFEIHRTSLRNPLRRNLNEDGFGPIIASDSSDFLTTDRQLHELHQGHAHNAGHRSSSRLEQRLSDRRSQQGFLDEPLIDPHPFVEDFGPEGHILNDVPKNGGRTEFHQFHNAPIGNTGDGHEGGRIGFRKIVKVTHEVEDVPRHGRQIEFGHGHYY